MKCRNSGDIDLIVRLNEQLNDEYLLKGTLLISLEDMGVHMKVFVPCAG